jgi:uncharacterized protein (TIGR02118 family)
MMIKVVTWFNRRPDLSVAEFRRYWREEHPKAVLRLPGLRAYNQNPTTDAGYAKGQPFCDGVAETWWDDLDTLQAHRGTAGLEALMIDETRFIDGSHRQSLVVDERVVVDGEPPPGCVKQFTWLTRRSELTPEQCHAYWRDHHGPLASTIPGIVRYGQNQVIDHLYRNGRQPAYDGIAIVHLAGMAEARSAAASPQLAATRADEPHFLDTARLPWVVADEIAIV